MKVTRGSERLRLSQRKLNSVAYDDKSDIFVAGDDSAYGNAFRLTELPKGRNSF